MATALSASTTRDPSGSVCTAPPASTSATLSGSGLGVRTRTDARELWARKSATG